VSIVVVGHGRAYGRLRWRRAAAQCRIQHMFWSTGHGVQVHVVEIGQSGRKVGGRSHRLAVAMCRVQAIAVAAC
jgi:hypothetical protein